MSELELTGSYGGWGRSHGIWTGFTVCKPEGGRGFVSFRGSPASELHESLPHWGGEILAYGRGRRVPSGKTVLEAELVFIGPEGDRRRYRAAPPPSWRGQRAFTHDRARAAEWLTGTLSRGPLRARSVLTLALLEGIPLALIEQARGDMGILSIPEGAQIDCDWSLPDAVADLVGVPLTVPTAWSRQGPLQPGRDFLDIYRPEGGHERPR